MFYSQQLNRRKRWYSLLTISQKKLLALAGLVVILLLVLLGGMAYYSIRAQRYDLTQVALMTGENQLFDSENRPIAPLDGDDARYVPWEHLPQHLINAFVAREDESFFSHDGVELSSVLRSLLSNIISMRYRQGASTITMQLTRNVFELQGKSMDRKLLETVLAQRIERKYSKQLILTQYLNRIYYGQNCYGIGVAARHYFGKPVSELNLVESATLAGLVRAPSLCNPEVNMENAMGVKRETLARMLELEFISQEEYDRAVAAPIVLSSGERQPTPSYTTMEARSELDALSPRLGDTGSGLLVGSSLNLRIQQYVELAAERALAAIESRNNFPTAWHALFGDDTAAAGSAAKAFASISRPKELRKRGIGNDLTGLLQCCVLVVDARRGTKGQILAISGGRCAVDNRNRWDETIKPGRALAPLVFCCACLPGGEDRHIVARDAVVTGRSIGYDVVGSFFESLKLDTQLPDREHADKLYGGEFELTRRELANLLFSIQNEGRGYDLHLIRYIWSRSGKLIFNQEQVKAPEYIRRESAVAVSRLSPFVCEEGKPIILSEPLPDGDGHWTMVSNDRGVCVFVWMGFDDSSTSLAANPNIRNLLRLASLYLAKEVHTEARRLVREQMAAQKEKE